MAEVNPYAAPKAAVADVQIGEQELATLWQRFAAAFVDGLIIGLAGIAAALLAGPLGGGPAALGIAVTLCLGFVALLNLWMMYRHRATLGKRTQKIRMVRSDGSEAELWRLIFLRGLPQWLIGALSSPVPLLGVLNLVDVFPIFGKRRRCAHDYVADTMVVKAE